MPLRAAGAIAALAACSATPSSTPPDTSGDVGGASSGGSAGGATGGTDPGSSSGGTSSGSMGGGSSGGSSASDDGGGVVVGSGGHPDAGGPVAAGASRGTITFHILLGVGGAGAGESLSLGGDNFTDLIASNYVAGAMYGHLIEKFSPGMLFEKDYLYGSIFGQLLQENLATEMYVSSSNLIDSSSQQQAVMAAGQGGPYQINNYAADMVHGTYAPQGNALINYVAIQKNIGYSFASATTQYTQPTPASFNDKFYGPMLTAYFHFNDFVALQKVGPVGGYTPPWEPAYDGALVAFKALPGNFLEVLLNVAYNQGYYGPLMTSYSQKGASANAATVASVNDYASVWGISDTYQQYPYQVRDYLDQIYDNPAPKTGTVPDNHVVFRAAGLGTIFANVFATLAYVDGSSAYSYIPADQASAAFTTAMTKAGLASTATLDLSNTAERAQVFGLLETAITTLEGSLKTDFTATTLAAL